MSDIQFDIGDTGALLRPTLSTSCANCKKSLHREAEFCRRVNICRLCLNVYGVIDAALNQAAERKTIEATRERFLSKFR